MTVKTVTCDGVLSHVTVRCHMLRCAVTCYGVQSPCTICIRACRRSFITCYVLPAASPLLHSTAGTSWKLTRASHEPVQIIRVGECFEWSELELEIFETFANFYHINGCSGGLSTLCKTAFCGAGSCRSGLKLRQLDCLRCGAPENTYGIP